MVHRKKDLTKPPIGLMHAKWDRLKAKTLIEKNDHKAKPECYRDETLDILSALYKNKCAICERERGTELQVDHFRPKKERNYREGVEYNQPGYYWLTYEWSNLIPLCSKCNGKKSNKFPLTGWGESNRINCHDRTGDQPYNFEWLQKKELPLLINPEYEKNPEKHFIFTKSGNIKGRTDMGMETIKIHQLNRKDLRRERLQIIKSFADKVTYAFDEFSINNDTGELKGCLKQVFREIHIKCDIDSSHSLFHVFIYRYFDYFIATKINNKIRQKAISYFNQFKTNYAI